METVEERAIGYCKYLNFLCSVGDTKLRKNCLAIPHGLNTGWWWSAMNFFPFRERPDMMSATEGSGGHGKADIEGEVA